MTHSICDAGSAGRTQDATLRLGLHRRVRAGRGGGCSTAGGWPRTGRAASGSPEIPSLDVDAGSLYVVDSKIWTSARVTTGIDMALALVETDLGGALANLIAQDFVLYARQPGYQSQFSPLLQAQAAAEAPFAGLIEWMQAHLDRKLDVPELAARAGACGTKLLSPVHRSDRQDAGALRRKPAPRRRPHVARWRPADKGDCRKGGIIVAVPLGQAFEQRFGMAPSCSTDAVTNRGRRHDR